MSKPQVKTQKLINLIDTLNSSLKTNNDISLEYFVLNNKLNLSYSVCVRRSCPNEVATKFKPSLDKFVNLWNKSTFSKGKKLKKIELKDYDYEYSEYEIEVSLNVSIQIGKNQEKFF